LNLNKCLEGQIVYACIFFTSSNQTKEKNKILFVSFLHSKLLDHHHACHEENEHKRYKTPRDSNSKQTKE